MEKGRRHLEASAKRDSMTLDLREEILDLMMTIMSNKKEEEMISGIWSPCLLIWEGEE